MSALPFQFECPASFFEKASAPSGQKRRIAGVISTETRDRQQEIAIQKGLNFDEFIRHGWYNDNHSKDTDGIVGYPDLVQQFAKGQVLPNGEKAHTNLTWAEGYLLEGHDRADRIWKLGTALQKSGGGRRLGFSIEGGIEQRTGIGNKTIAKARVRNVAVTNCPVNTDTRLEIIAKSLIAVQQSALPPIDEFVKGLGMGTPSGAAIGTQGPQTGMGAGQVLAPQSLETGKQSIKFEEDEDDKKKLNKAEAILWLYERYPNASAQTLGRIVDTTLSLKRNGLL